MRLNWGKAFAFPFYEKDGTRILFRGGLFLLFPVLGWPLALGYRKQVAFRLAHGKQPVLVDFMDTFGENLETGVRVVLVIYLYFLPLILLSYVLGMEGVAFPTSHPWWTAGYFLSILLLIPVFLPATPVFFHLYVDGFHLAPAEGGLLFAGFVVCTFLLPALFLQASLRKDLTACRRFGTGVMFVYRNFATYLEAWVGSLVATAVAFLVVPLIPWGIFWSYLTIVYFFNQVLATDRSEEIRERMSRRHFQ